MDAGSNADGHRYFEDLAVAHVLGGLDEAEGQAFRSHLLDCSDCRARVGELRAIAHELADVERAERRERAAQTLETKRRDDDEDPGDDTFESPSRLSRIVAIGALVLVVALAAWNFALRSQAERLQDGLEDLEFAATVLETGEPGDVQRKADGISGSVKVAQNHAVVVVEGLDDGQWYGLFVLDSQDTVIYRAPVRASNGRLFSRAIRLERGATTILVGAPGESGGGTPDDQPSGWTLFQARLPAASE